MLTLGWRCKTAAMLFFTLTRCPAAAETLSQTLIQESPNKLVLEAREQGDVVRGAILFHQGKIACAKCHRQTDERNRIGPDLSRLGPDVTDESLVESILQPSKVIKPEYRTSKILHIDGRVILGVVISQDDKHGRATKHRER